MLDNTFPQNDFSNLWVETPYQRYFKKVLPYQIPQNKNSTWAIPHYTFQNLRNAKKETNVAYVQLFNKVTQVWKSAQGFLNEVDDEQAKQAFQEAIALTRSQLFSEEINPDVCVDDYGEFTFSHESSAGYVDIGVRGERELSYHIRNDIDPNKTAFDDCEWDLLSLPKDLSIAMENLQQEIRGQFDPSK